MGAVTVTMKNTTFQSLTRALLLTFTVTGVACSANSAASSRDDDRTSNDDPDGSTTPDGGTGEPDGGGSTAAARFFLPTGEPDNTSAPTIEVDAQGNTHAVYPAYAGGDAYYAFCAAGCSKSEDVKVVRFPTDGTTHNAMLALDAQGRPRVLLSSYSKLYYATCDADCTKESSWRTGMILDHAAKRDVTGEALALDPQGRPRFIMHTYKAYLDIGQEHPETLYMTCDADCTSGASWISNIIATDAIFEQSTLRFDAQGRARLLAVGVVEEDGDKVDMAGYYECDADCTTPAGWNGIHLAPTFASQYEAVSIRPTAKMALTKSGAPRVAIFASTPDDGRAVVYLTCDQNCIQDNWSAVMLSKSEELAAGLDIALDDKDRPRIAFNMDYNIGLVYCDDAACADEDATWSVTKVEAGSDMPPDEIFLYEGCTVGAWFLHDPSIALTRDGRPRVGYQARDISGGGAPGCVAGTDMTWARLAVLPSVK